MALKRYKTLAAREGHLAFGMLTPAFLIVFTIILFPVAANFWISFKPVKLGDLRAARPILREQIVAAPERPGDILELRYRIRNSSQERLLEDVRLRARLPIGLEALELPPGFRFNDRMIEAVFGDLAGGFSDVFDMRFRVQEEYFTADQRVFEAGSDRPVSQISFAADSVNPLTNLQFTIANYSLVLSESSFFASLGVTFAYTLFGALGALLLGLLAALLVNRKFAGRGVVRGLFLFPYVAPIIAVAFTWVFLLDPFSGTINALLVKFGIVNEGISFLSQRPTALISVILFDAWRYFPFAFLFILARLQAIPKPLYESAEVDGAGPYRTFFAITLPQLRDVVGTIFLLRFMWTFNRFDDIFLLTGGSAGTQTIPIQVYDNAFGRSDIGAGSATAVLLFVFLALTLGIYIRVIERDEAA